MSLITGLAISLAVMILSAGALTVFAIVLRKRDQTRANQRDGSHLKHA